MDIKSAFAATFNGILSVLATASSAIGLNSQKFTGLGAPSATPSAAGGAAAIGSSGEAAMSDHVHAIAFGSDAQGDIAYRSATGWTRLGAGTTGQALVTAGASANPTWTTNFQAQNIVTTGTFTSGVAKIDASIMQLSKLVSAGTYGALYCGATAVGTPSVTNFSFASDGADTAISGSTQARMAVANVNRVLVNGTGIGFFNVTPVAKPTVTGSKGANAALTSLMTALANLGLVTDSTS